VFPAARRRALLRKRTGVVRELLPNGGTVLDVGCGTGALAG
jgi:ubiquinone/menaquinone biosynthesis C-methylase UbiE